VSRQAPGWLTWVLAGGLALVFLGERVLPGASTVRWVASSAGTLLVLASAGWRVASWLRARAAGPAEAARIEAQLALAYAGCVLALALYFLSTDAGMSVLRLDFANDAARGRYHTALQVLWAIVAAVSLLPVLVAGLAQGARSAAGADGLLEAERVAEAFNTGLVIALAGALLFVVGFVAARRDRSVDLGYFRTSRPGTATRALAHSLRNPVQVLLFFPDASPVKREVEDYFQALARSGARLRVEEHDRLADPDVTRRFDVRDDGTVLLMAGDHREKLVLPVDMEQARSQLRTLDREVQGRLMQLARGPRVAYLTVGHGELNDTLSDQVLAQKGLGGVDALRALLRLLNYDVKNLGLSTGLGRDVPSDAAVVLVLGPRRSFLPEELATVDRYFARGGSLLLAMQPPSDFRLGPLERQLGVRFDGVPLADDQQYVRRRGDLSDRGLLVTDRFSSHLAVKTASLAGPDGAALFPDPGRLEAVDSSAVHPTFLVRTLPSAFLDRNGDYQADGPQEKRGEYELAAAVQSDSARALVYADAEMFTDAVLSSVRSNASLAADGLRWLGREEALSGTTVSEEDVPIQHTQAQDVGWFYSTILGAPALVLAFGLVGVRRHRRKGRQA
jgi:hypothetical protein